MPSYIIEEFYVWPCSPPPAGANLWARGMGYLSRRDAVPSDWLMRRYCIHLVVRGSGIFLADGKEFRAQAGDLYCFRPGIRMQLTPDRDNPWERYWITLEGDGAGAYVKAFGLDTRHMVVRARNAARAKKIFRRMIDVYREAEDGEQANVLSFMYQLVSACRSPGLKEAYPAEEESKIVARALSAFDSFPKEQFTVAEIAHHLGVGRSTLYRAFQKQFHKSPSKHIADLRMAVAKELLLSTNDKISAIARSVGFSDEKYFLRRFRMETGLTPSQYRKQG